MTRYAYIAVGALVVLGAAYYALSSRGTTYTSVAVVRGPIVAESLSSGHVESPTSAALSFKNSGKLTALTVSTGQEVAAGEVLARQDTSVLSAQLSQAQAALAQQQANLATLKEGTRPQQLAVTRAQISSDQAALAQANQALTDALTSAYTAADSALQNDIDPFFNNPDSQSPQVSFSLPDSQLGLALAGGRVQAGSTLAAWGSAVASLSPAGDLAGAVRQAQAALTQELGLLGDAGQALSKALPSATVSAAQLTTWAAGVASARTSLTTAQGALTSAATAQTTASSTLNKDQQTLALQEAGSTASAIAAGQAAVDAAAANVQALAAQIRDLEIIAPFAGTVTDTQGTVGETVTPSTAVVSLIPHVALDVKVNVSEDNIVGIKVGDHARIELDAFPSDITFSGTVSAIDPAQTDIGGAVYYQTTVLFDQNYPGIRPGMTANVWIQTASSSDALLVPASALQGGGASSSVEVLAGGRAVPTPVTTGIAGQNGMVQIRSGLSEGQRVITGTQ